MRSDVSTYTWLLVILSGSLFDAASLRASQISSQPAAGFVAWFKADTIAGLADGDPVTVWEDAGPNNNDAAQTNASFRPIYKVNVVNGKPVVRFDGVDDRLVSPSGSGMWGLTNHFTVFAVVWLETSPGSNGHDVVGSNSLSNRLDLFARRADSVGNWLAIFTSPDGVRNSDFVMPTGSWHVLTWRLRANSPKHLQIRADTLYRLNDTNYTGIGTAPSTIALGARPDGVNPFKGDISEVLFYTTSISDSAMAATEDYLRGKYGLIEPPPDPPVNLEALASAYFRIALSWVDNTDNEEGFRVERREGQTGTWEEIATLDANTTAHHDQSPPLAAETEYCYRVASFNANGQSAPSNEACETTLPIPVVACYSDPVGEQRGILLELLYDSRSNVVAWKDAVGLSAMDPGQLELITADSLCQQIWSGTGLGRPPDAGSMATFFQLGNRYIVADYPLGSHAQTIVLDQQLNLVNPILTD